MPTTSTWISVPDPACRYAWPRHSPSRWLALYRLPLGLRRLDERVVRAVMQIIRPIGHLFISQRDPGGLKRLTDRLPLGEPSIEGLCEQRRGAIGYRPIGSDETGDTSTKKCFSD